MNIRTAILKAADSIEQNPKLFNFQSSVLPKADCGTPACAIGWIAYHAGLDIPYEDRIMNGLGGYGGKWMSYNNLVYTFLGITEDCCFKALDQFESDWHHSPLKCAAALRLYADKYHPAQGIPESVLARVHIERQPVRSNAAGTTRIKVREIIE